ncbi:hypothetical protein QUB08_29135 [Microcoleus sp. BR0-C5]|uniref:hypothetical protein n=1 Tax=Microcoleus sp. BR0-C5 TaxID=2818713 RepID=UPI002FD38843
MVLEKKLKLIRDVETGIIAHQVCCVGVLHTGLGSSIAAKWPVVELEYRRFCGPDAGGARFVLGKVQMVRVSSTPELWVCSIAGQNLHGSKKRYTDYDALALCLSKLHHKSLELELTPFLPYKLGWSGGRGEWSVVRPLIEQHCPNAVICID